MNGTTDLVADGLSGVSRETLEKLRVFEELLRKWTAKVNLVAPSSLEDLWTRHIADSAQLSPLAPGAKIWVDIGSGGGLPGLVVAILNAELNPGCRHRLIESDVRKAAFLQEAARATDTPVEILRQRAEDAPPQGADVVSARALAPLPRLLAYAHRHLAPNGACIFPKGASASQELEAAGADWRMRVTTKPSVTNVDSTILIIEELERVEPA